MKLSYDPHTDSLYIHLADRPSVDSDEVTDGVVLDFDENGALVGIDVQHFSHKGPIFRIFHCCTCRWEHWTAPVTLSTTAGRLNLYSLW